MQSVGKREMSMIFPRTWEYTGTLEYKDMSLFYNNISVGVLPSYSEVCPNFILECYMHARPVIVSPQAIPPEMPLFGWKADHNVENWVDIIKNVKDPYKLGLEAREWLIHNWDSWDDYAEKLFTLFSETISTSSLMRDSN
jgi:glycosyltransferase involved in cell wall biosynthesis